MQERKVSSETSDEGKKGKRKWELWVQWLTFAAAFAAVVIQGFAFYHQKKYDDYQQQKDKKEEQEEEEDHRPHFVSEQGGKIPVGLQNDYSACERQVRELCGKVDVQDYACHSYIFFCFRYVQDGQEKDVYYLLKWEGDGSWGATELTEPDEVNLYKEAIPMKLEQ